ATLSLTPVPGTTVCGRVFATQYDVSPSGEVINIPLEGATIRLDGTDVTTTTDALGSFRLDDAPAGRFFVHIDGTSVTSVTIGGVTTALSFPDGAYFPTVGKPWEAVAGEETQVADIFLPLMEPGALVAVSETEATEICFTLETGEEICVTVPAGALFGEGGATSGSVGIGSVDPSRLPGQPPAGLDFARVITVQTDGGTNFEEPVAVCFPNEPDPNTGLALEPGDHTALWSFNHDSGQWEVVATMTVTDDGRICTDPGGGILAPGWHATMSATTATGGTIVDESDGDSGDEDEREPPPENPDPEPVADEEEADAVCAYGGKVLLHSGEEMFERVDLAIPGRGGLDFQLVRRYRSQWHHDGPLGHNWDFNYNDGLYPRPNGDIVRANGRGRVSHWPLLPQGGHAPPTGYFYDLGRNARGDFVITDANGFRRYYHPDGRLQAHEDRNGNRMLFEYDERGNLDLVIDTYGREIDFIFEPEAGRDRLVRVRDFAGREIRYLYDSSGDLVEVRGPRILGTSTGNDFPGGRIERYSYSSGFAEPELNHNLLSVTYPEEVETSGPPAITWDYGEDPGDPLTFDKVLAEHLGGGRVNSSGIPAGGTTTFEYEMLNQGIALGDLNLLRGKATITERNGNQLEYFVNERKHHILTRVLTRGLRPDEPEYFETRSEYDADGQLVRRILPEGNEVRYAYGSGARSAEKNVIEERRIADPDRGGGEDLVTTYVYEPIHNQLAAHTDPRGNASGFEPPLGEASPARYSTRWFFDYQEGDAQSVLALAAARGVDLDPDGPGPITALDVAASLALDEDLNGDGRTDQQAGNVVRREEPAVLLPEDSNEAARFGSTTQLIVHETQWNDRGQPVAGIDAEGNLTTFEYYPEIDPDGDGTPVFSLFMPLTAADASGWLRTTTVDAGDTYRRTARTPPLALTEGLRYDRVGNVVATTNARGVSTEIEFNAANEAVRILRGADVTAAVSGGQLREGTEALRLETRLRYDHNGRRIREEEENRHQTTPGVGPFVERTWDFDLLGNVVRVTIEAAADTILEWGYEYDASELLVRMTAPEGDSTTREYDERNFLFRDTRGAGSAEAATRRFDYDGNGNRIRAHDAADSDGDGEVEATGFTFDGFDRLIGIEDALGNEERRSYDPASN
ncbi:MAG: DUF6531 domain-containing protein, partial [Actinobacteria bacterium]|nr:DUF6531 domain-containing protein [Actinomycetota bacterium]